MPTKLISTFNGVTQAAGAGPSLIIDTVGLPTIQSIWGYCNGTAGTQYFLQLFNKATVPANTTVPLVSLQVTGGNGFGPFNYQEKGWGSDFFSSLDKLIIANGLILCLSTTEGTLTIGTGNVTMDVMVQIDTGDVPLQFGAKVTTALSSGVQTVVSDPNQSKLVRFTATNNDGVGQFIALFGANPNTTTFSTNFIPMEVYEFPATAVNQLYELGNQGRFINQTDASYKLHTGLYLAVLNTDANGNLLIPYSVNTGSASTITSYYI